jgi:TolB-like protein
MKQITFFFAIIFFNASIINAQTIKVAILDFENTSGIAKYDGLGKAMSSMLITDIEANVSPKRLQLVERSQIQKILKEQNFQATSAVDKTSSVKAGKLLGVKYLLVGDIYILNDVLVINARLTDTETGDIKFSKKQEGKLVGWLNLKTNIAKELAKSIALPFTEPNIPDKEINMATITSFGNAITAKDEGKIDKAEELANTIQEFSPDFKYLDDLKSQLDELKKQVEKNTTDIKNLNVEVTENITDYLELGYKYTSENNFVNAEKYFLIGFSKVDRSNIVNHLECIFALSQLYYNKGNYVESLKYSNIGLAIYPYFKEFLYFKYLSYAKLNQLKEFNQIIQTSIDIINIKSDSLIITYLKKYSTNNNVQYDDIEGFLQWKQNGFTTLIKAIRYNGEFNFNSNYDISFNTIAIDCIQEVYNENPKQAALLLKQLDLSKSSSEVKAGFAWYTMLAGDFINAQKQWDEIVLNSFWRISDCADYKLTKMVKCSNLLINSVVSVYYNYDKKNGIIFQDSIREYHPDGTIRKIALAEDQRKTVKLKNPYWYYEYEDGRGFVTTNPLEAYIFNANTQYPINTIIDCIKSSGCINWYQILESNKMAIINWGHSHLLSGDTDAALKIYQLFPSDFEFGKDFQHMKYTQVLLNDWSDFEKLGLISKNKIAELKEKLASSNKLK